MTRVGATAAAIAIGLSGAVLLAAADVKVLPVVTDGRVLAGFTAASDWAVEDREVLQTGQLLTFTYEVQLRRSTTLWLDSVLADTNIQASAKLDTLTGAYQVTRQRDRLILKVERRDQESDVRDWLTVFEPLLLEPEPPLKSNNDYYVTVRLFKSPRRSVSLWRILPFGVGGGDSFGRAEFTFIR